MTMTPEQQNIVGEAMNLLIQDGSSGMADFFRRLYEVAMQLERQQFMNAAPYQRTSERNGYANGYKPKKIDTPAGTITVRVPKTAGHEAESFYPQSLEVGRRSTRALMMAAAEMYISGVSTRQVEKVMQEFGIESLSSTQVSRATKQLDKELEAWRNRPIGVMKYLILNARYEKARQDGVVRDAAVLTAIGIGEDERRHVLGVSVKLSEAEVHWRDFLQSLKDRGLVGTEFIVADDHAGLKAARRAVFGGIKCQRCQFHLAQNAVNHAPNNEIRKKIGKQLRDVWNAKDLKTAEAELSSLVASYRDKHQDFADWLEDNVPEGLVVFKLPEAHRKRMRTSNGIERPVQQELKRRTYKVRVFPNVESLLRLASAVLVEIDEKWQTDSKPYIKWKQPDD